MELHKERCLFQSRHLKYTGRKRVNRCFYSAYMQYKNKQQLVPTVACYRVHVSLLNVQKKKKTRIRVYPRSFSFLLQLSPRTKYLQHSKCVSLGYLFCDLHEQPGWSKIWKKYPLNIFSGTWLVKTRYLVKLIKFRIHNPSRKVFFLARD